VSPAKKVVEFGPEDVEQPLLTTEDAAFDELPEEPGSAGATLTLLAAARDRGRLAHALLLAGPPGAGKRWAAVRLAQLLSCTTPRPARPCGTCTECHRTERGLDPDVVLLQPPWDDRKGAPKSEIPVELVRGVQELLSFRAMGRRRVVIVDPADRLSIVAQEALLKTLEEPPEGVTLLLLTSRASFLKPTIRSRAHLVRVQPPSPPALTDLLRSRGVASEAADVSARLAAGDVRQALLVDSAELGERWVSLARVLYEILGPKGERRARDLAVEVVPAKGEEGSGRDEAAAFLTLLQRILRDACVAGTAGEAAPSLLIHPGAAKAAQAISQRLPPEAAAAALAAVETAREDLALNMSVKLVLTHLLLSIRASAARG
jgi:DNA polymerase-3 subunit delta'